MQKLHSNLANDYDNCKLSPDQIFFFTIIYYFKYWMGLLSTYYNPTQAAFMLFLSFQK